MRVTIAAAGLLAAACQRPAEDPAVLTLGDQSVKRSEFLQHLRRLEARGDGPLDPAVRAAVLESFLEERALLLEARRRGLLAKGADEMQEAAGIKKLLDSELLGRLEITPEEVQREYLAQAGSWNQPERRTLSQILLPTLNEARDVRRRLDRDPKSFELLARSRSRAPEAAQGGAMGSFSPGQLPIELEQAAFGLKVAEHSAIVETPYGFHVLRVDQVEPARERPKDECEAQIRARLLADKSEALRKAFLRELLARAKVNHEAANATAPS